jgi:hypothetical protein
VNRAQFVNLLIFVAVVVCQITVVSVAAALASDTMPGFREGELFRPGRDLAIGLLALLGPIIGGWVIQNRPRFGSEPVAAQVNDLRAQGVSRQDMVVTTADTVATALSDRPFTPEQVDQLTTALLAKTGRAA